MLANSALVNICKITKTWAHSHTPPNICIHVKRDEDLNTNESCLLPLMVCQVASDLDIIWIYKW